MGDKTIRFLGRCDDAGSCHTANAAIVECLDTGVALNVSVMACCPFFDEAARMLAGRSDIDVGLHATVTAEWDAVKWGPVLPPEQVGSLVDARGYFHPTTKALEDRGATAEHILAEVEAQLACARAAGLEVAYLDEHMAFSWLPGVEEGLAALREREGLVQGYGQERLPEVEGDFPDVADALIAQLEAAEPGTYLLVGHPGHDTAEMRRLGHAGLTPGHVARERELDTRRFTDPKVLDYVKTHAIQPARFSELEN
jgi:predicted glycoside hydrolase/deacetylase ChbG (UPF0249 family)